MALMQIRIDQEFIMLCEQILKEGRSLEEWREFESDDMFQSARYTGGFDAIEDAFCFSYYDSGGGEFWFQLTPAQISEIVAGNLKAIEVRSAEVL
jgi:hypothetical protein